MCDDDDDDVNSICVANTNCYLEIDSVAAAAATQQLCILAILHLWQHKRWKLKVISSQCSCRWRAWKTLKQSIASAMCEYVRKCLLIVLNLFLFFLLRIKSLCTFDSDVCNWSSSLLNWLMAKCVQNASFSRPYSSSRCFATHLFNQWRIKIIIIIQRWKINKHYDCGSGCAPNARSFCDDNNNNNNYWMEREIEKQRLIRSMNVERQTSLVQLW